MCVQEKQALLYWDLIALRAWSAWEGSPLQRAMECDENKRAVMTFSSKSLPERTAVWRLGPKYPKFMETKQAVWGVRIRYIQ